MGYSSTIKICQNAGKSVASDEQCVQCCIYINFFPINLNFHSIKCRNLVPNLMQLVLQSKNASNLLYKQTIPLPTTRELFVCYEVIMCTQACEHNALLLNHLTALL